VKTTFFSEEILEFCRFFSLSALKSPWPSQINEILCFTS